MTEQLHTKDPAKRAAQLETIMKMILDEPGNAIQSGQRLRAEIALYGLDEAIARSRK